MSQIGAPRHDPVPIGEVAAPPFARLPDPLTIFAQRTHCLRALAQGRASASTFWCVKPAIGALPSIRSCSVTKGR
jgi:hypothetical protein